MLTSRHISTALAFAGLGLASSALAGFTAIAGPYTPILTDVDNNGAVSLNDTAYNRFGRFSSWVGDTPSDLSFPAVQHQNLNLSLFGRVTSIVGDEITYTGNFSIFFYDAIRIFEVSYELGGGSYTMTSRPDGAGGRTLGGQLVQTYGRSPFGTQIPDLGERYNRNPIDLTGTVTSAGANTVRLRQNAVGVVPEPATFAALGLGVAAILRRRRKA